MLLTAGSTNKAAAGNQGGPSIEKLQYSVYVFSAEIDIIIQDDGHLSL